MRNEDLKKFHKYFKKSKKQLIKHAKEFMFFDYSFMETLIYDCIKIYYEFYKNPNHLLQDTTHEISTYKEDVEALKRCVEIINKLENLEYGKCEEERDLKYEFYDLIKKYHFAWWD